MDIKQLTPRGCEIFLKEEFSKYGFLKDDSIETSLGGKTNAADFYSYVLKTPSLSGWHRHVGSNLRDILFGHDRPKKSWFNSLRDYVLSDRCSDGPTEITRLLYAKVDRVQKWVAEFGFQLVCNNDGTDCGNYNSCIGFGVLESLVKYDLTKDKITCSIKSPPKHPKRFVLKDIDSLRRIAEDSQRDPRDIEAAKYLVELLNK